MNSKDQENYNRLVKDLNEKAKEQPDAANKILKKLEGKMYHDMESPLCCPKLTLAKDLNESGWNDLADKVYGGQYDF